MTTIYIPKSTVEAFRAGDVTAAIIKPRKSLPTTGTILTVAAGGWGKAVVVGTVECKAVRPVTRMGPGHWSYGVLNNHMTISNLDLRHLAKSCGMTADELDAKWAKQKPKDYLVKVSW